MATVENLTGEKFLQCKRLVSLYKLKKNSKEFKERCGTAKKFLNFSRYDSNYKHLCFFMSLQNYPNWLTCIFL